MNVGAQAQIASTILVHTSIPNRFFAQFACYLHLLMYHYATNLRCLSISPYLITSSVASGCGSKCPQLQFRQSELSVFQCFDGSPGSGHLSAPLSLHLQPAVGWYDSH